MFFDIVGAGGFVLFFAAPIGGDRQFGIPIAPGRFGPFLGGFQVGLGGLDLFLVLNQVLEGFVKRFRLHSRRKHHQSNNRERG